MILGLFFSLLDTNIRFAVFIGAAEAKKPESDVPNIILHKNRVALHFDPFSSFDFRLGAIFP